MLLCARMGGEKQRYTLTPRYPGLLDFTNFVLDNDGSGTTGQVLGQGIWNSQKFIRGSEVSGLSRSGIAEDECTDEIYVHVFFLPQGKCTRLERQVGVGHAHLAR